ncbi:MAG: hypothetical protein SOZ13_19135 [Enterococcus avium]|uniref:Uncharacterized protein n=1 Tax=Enterococcus avium TaxID=33945 RepID=A0A437UPF6_ENTAV|nr:hypothetical protein [Enterococcus avium]MDY4027190.1 hypothetical protein [Enterococcus avium]RVU95488.1 hypothetical protein EK398_11945 [Enterococcus avium]
MVGKHWTEDELIYLEYFVFENDSKLKEASCFLGRSVNAIRKKLSQLRKNKDYNVGYMHRLWTEEELNFIKRNYTQMTYEDIAKKLNRGAAAVELIARENGIRKHKKLKDFDTEIRELATSGYCPAEIARELNIKAGSVRSYMIAQNINYRTLSKSESLIRARERSTWKETNSFLFKD